MAKLMEATKLMGREFRTRPFSTTLLMFGGALVIKAFDEASIKRTNEKIRRELDTYPAVNEIVPAEPEQATILNETEDLQDA